RRLHAPHSSTLFSYTTLFRSQDVFYTIGDESNKLLLNAYLNREPITVFLQVGKDDEAGRISFEGEAYITEFPMDFALDNAASIRSEEHTSELQSRFDLVCRLL